MAALAFSDEESDVSSSESEDEDEVPIPLAAVRVTQKGTAKHASTITKKKSLAKRSSMTKMPVATKSAAAPKKTPSVVNARGRSSQSMSVSISSRTRNQSCGRGGRSVTWSSSSKMPKAKPVISEKTKATEPIGKPKTTMFTQAQKKGRSPAGELLSPPSRSSPNDSKNKVQPARLRSRSRGRGQGRSSSQSVSGGSVAGSVMSRMSTMSMMSKSMRPISTKSALRKIGKIGNRHQNKAHNITRKVITIHEVVDSSPKEVTIANSPKTNYVDRNNKADKINATLSLLENVSRVTDGFCDDGFASTPCSPMSEILREHPME